MKQVPVGTADAAGLDADQQFAGAGPWLFHLAERDFPDCFQPHCLHAQFSSDISLVQKA